MFQNPLQKPLPVGLAGSDRQNNVNQFLLFIAKFYPIDSQKNQHGMSADPFIPIHKGMVAYQAKTQLRRFCLQGWINRFSAESLKRRGQCRFQQPFVTNPVDASKFLNQRGMQAKDLAF